MKKSVVLTLFITATLWASDQKAPSVVDSGTFAVRVGGKRVATESFTMQQGANGNTVTSKLDFENGATKVHQQAELEIGADGALRKYTWQETQPGNAKITAEPQDKTFLMVRQKANDADTAKEALQPLDTHVTSIVDDNFYSHVQVLVWRYMAMSCTREGCKYAEQKLPVFVPHQEMAQLFTLTYAGTDPIQAKNGSVQATRYRVMTEAGEMQVWMDGFKMMKLTLPGNTVEVVRE